TSKDILRFYTDHAEEIFPAQGVVARARSYIWSQYSQDPLAALLKETFGDEAWLSDCLTDMIIPTYDMRGGLPYTFRTSDARKYASSNFRVYESLIATSAAPTYFDSVKIKNKEGEERVFSDGGTAANNPMLEALRRAVKKFRGYNIVVISLGTGRIPMESIERLSQAGKGYYAPALAKLFMDNSESRAREAFDDI